MGLLDSLQQGMASADSVRGAMVAVENEPGTEETPSAKRPSSSLLSSLADTLQAVSRPHKSARLDNRPGKGKGSGKGRGKPKDKSGAQVDHLPNAWHFRTKFGNQKFTPPASISAVGWVTRIINKDSGGREAFVRFNRVRSVSALEAYLITHGKMPEGDEHVEVLNVSGTLPTTSSNVLLVVSKFEYQGTSNPRFFPTLRVIGGSNTNTKPIPCTRERLAYMLDATSTTVHSLMKWYKVPDENLVVPNYVLAQWSRTLLRMVDSEYRVPTVPPKINRQLHIIDPRWDYANISDHLNDGKDRLVPPLIQKKLQLLVEYNSDGKKAMNSNATFVRSSEKEDGQWNDFRSFANRGAASRGGISEDNDEAKKDEMKRILELYEYLVIPLRAIAQGFCTTEFRTRKRVADDTEKQLVFKLINSYILPMMNADQARHIDKMRQSEVDVGRRSRASFIEKTAALEYMSLESLYKVTQIVQTQPWIMAISVIFRKVVPLPVHMRWKEMTLPELARVMNMYNIEALDPVVASAIALYQHQLRDALEGFVAKDTFVPFSKISAHAKEMNKVSMVTNALEFLEREGVIIVDADEDITRAAKAYYGELRRQREQAKGPAARALIPHVRDFADDDRRVYLANVYTQELGIVDKLGAVMKRAGRKPFLFLGDKQREMNAMQMMTGGISLDEGQQAAVDAVMFPVTPRDSVIHVTGPPGTGKSAVICTIALNAADKSKVMCTALSSAATDNVRQRMAGHPYNLNDAVVCANLAQIGSGTDTRVSDASRICEMLIIDEATMLDTLSFYRVLRNLPFLKKLVLVGDPNQLGAVGYGTPMEDMMRVFPVHMLTKMYRATGLLNYNAKILIKDPWNAVNNSEYALSSGVEELRTAHKFDPAPLYEATGVTEAQFRATGRRGAEYLKMQLHNREEAGKALLQTSPCVYIPRDGNELTKENPKASTIEKLMDFLIVHHNAREEDIQVISAYNAPGLIICTAMQRFYRRKTFDPRDYALQQRLLRAALARRCSFEAGADDDAGSGDGEFSSGTNINPKHNRCPLMMMPGDSVVFTHNQTTASGLSMKRVFNGDKRKIKYIVDVGKTRGDPLRRDIKSAEGPSTKMTYYPPDMRHIEDNAHARGYYDSRLRHSYVPETPDLTGVGRFLYFTNGERIYFGDFKRDSLLLGYCLTTHRFQGGQAKYVMYVITKDDIEGKLSSRRTDLVAKTRVTERMFIIGTPAEAEKIVRRNPVMGYSAFMFRLEILMDKDYPTILEAQAAQAKKDAERKEEAERREAEMKEARDKALAEAAEMMEDGAFDDDIEPPMTERDRAIAEAMEDVPDDFFD